MDNDWLDSLFEDPVLNDKMITDAVQPPRIHSEHSYSINDNSVPSSPLGIGKLEGKGVVMTYKNVSNSEKYRMAQSTCKP